MLDARPRARSVAGVEDVGDELVVLPLVNVPFLVATVVTALLVPRVALAALVVLLAAGYGTRRRPQTGAQARRTS